LLSNQIIFGRLDLVRELKSNVYFSERLKYTLDFSLRTKSSLSKRTLVVPGALTFLVCG